MTSYYKYLPGKSSRRSKFGLGCRYIWQYLFAFTLLLTIVFLTLYEFYFTVVENSKNGMTEPGILEAIVCQVFVILKHVKYKVYVSMPILMGNDNSKPQILGLYIVQFRISYVA